MLLRRTRLDCSHLVHYLYGQVGLHYRYMDSGKLYTGGPGFKRVAVPRSGDLVVWRGHVGIVADPERQTFLSALRTGVEITSYDSHYWKSRGEARFLRYEPAPD